MTVRKTPPELRGGDTIVGASGQRATVLSRQELIPGRWLITFDDLDFATFNTDDKLDVEPVAR